MNLLLIDELNVGLSFALHAKAAGHSVRWFLTSPVVGRGFDDINIVENWVSSVPWAELVIHLGGHRFIDKLGLFKSRGVPVFAPSKRSGLLETDRKERYEFFDDVGIMQPKTIIVFTKEEAISYCSLVKERQVFKTIQGNETYVAHSPADMVAYLRRKPEFNSPALVQEFIDGVPVSFSRTLGPSGWVDSTVERLQHSGVWVEYSSESDVLGSKIETKLLSRGHVGRMTIGALLHPSGLYGLSVKCGMTWPAEAIGLKKGSVSHMADGTSGPSSKTVGCCIAIHAPRSVGAPLYGVSRGTSIHVHLQGVRGGVVPWDSDNGVVDKKGLLVCDEYPAVVTGHGKTISQAIKRAMSTVSKLKISGFSSPVCSDTFRAYVNQLHVYGHASSIRY